MFSTRKFVAAGLTLVLLPSACSRTERIDATAAGLAAPAQDSSGRSDGATPVAEAAETGSGGGLSESNTVANPSNQSSNPSSNQPSDGGAPGPIPNDGSPVRVGFGWIDIRALVVAFGDPSRTNPEQPPSRDSAEAVVEWANANGGINGHPIEAYYYEILIAEILTAGGAQRTEQAMCEYFKENDVTLAVPLVSSQGVFNTCAHNAGIISIAAGNSDEIVDAKRFAEIGATHYRPNWLSGERRERLLVPQFQRAGFFTADAKVGVMVEDTPAGHRIATNALSPALKAIGANVVKTIFYDPYSQDDRSYILQMQSADADHIFFSGCACGGTQASTFMSTAENQGYRPIYGLATDVWLGGMIATGAPEAQLKNVIGLGWAPFMDSPGGPAYDEAAPINDADGRCRQIWKDSGLSASQNLTVIAIYCEAVFFLQQGFRGTPDLSARTFQAAVESSSFLFDSPTTYGARFASSHHDGVIGVRDLAPYESDCKCFPPKGPIHPLE